MYTLPKIKPKIKYRPKKIWPDEHAGVNDYNIIPFIFISMVLVCGLVLLIGVLFDI